MLGHKKSEAGDEVKAQAAEAATGAEEASAEAARSEASESDKTDANAEEAPKQFEHSEAEWRAALETAVKQRDDYLTMAQRAQADFQNFKRRNATVRTDAYDDGARETIASLLPTLDNLERALLSVGESEGPLADGVKMTQRQLLEALAKLGLEEVPALGEQFDPELHNAVTRAGEGEPGVILEVYQKGYRVKGRMIRYAMVRIPE